MTRYIDADELEKRTVLVEGDEFDGEYVIPYASFEILPTIDAIPKIYKAKWKVFEDENCPQCTQCGTWMPFARYRRKTGRNARLITDFCPGCGSKMVAIDQCSDCPNAENGCSREEGICYACRGDAWIYGKPIRVYEELKANKKGGHGDGKECK